MTSRRLTALMLAWMALALGGCVLLTEGGDDDDDSSDGSGGGGGGGGAPLLDCSVGDWMVGGNTGTGSCLPYSGLDIWVKLRFEQEGDQVFVSLVDASDEFARVVFAESEGVGSSCHLRFHIQSDAYDVSSREMYEVWSGPDLSLEGQATMIATYDGGEPCEQSWPISGTRTIP